MLALCVAGVGAVAVHVRCVDAAREVARLAARGQDATTVARPAGAQVVVRRDGDRVVARVSAPAPLLPGVVVDAEAVAAMEPGRR